MLLDPPVWKFDDQEDRAAFFRHIKTVDPNFNITPDEEKIYSFVDTALEVQLKIMSEYGKWKETKLSK